MNSEEKDEYRGAFQRTIGVIDTGSTIVKNPWVHVMSAKQAVLLAALCDWAKYLYGTNVSLGGKVIDAHRMMEQRDFFFYVPNAKLLEKTGMGKEGVARAIKELAHLRLVEVLWTDIKYEQRRLIRINAAMLDDLSRVWTSIMHGDRTRLDERDNEGGALAGIESKLAKAIAAARQTASTWQNNDGGAPVADMDRGTTIESLPLSDMMGRGCQTPPATKVYLRNHHEVSSSKIPGAVEDSSAQEGSVPLASRRRIPQGLLTPQADPSSLFKRNGNAAPGKEAATAADTRVADSLLAYWNKALPHKKQSKHKRNGDGEVNKYYKGFVSKIDELLKGTLFAAHEVDAKYFRKFSVHEVRKAIDHFALYPADIQHNCKNIEDFMKSEVPNKQPFRNGCGRSWMLRCLFGDDPYKPLPLGDAHPELTSAIIDQYCRQVLKGSIHQFDVIDRNHFIQAAAGLHTFYEANNHKLAAASNDVIRLARSLVQVVSKWGTPSPAALHSSRMFTEHLPQSLFSQHAMIDKTAKVQGEGYAVTEAPIDIYAPLTIPEEYL